jgi:hypothetical protein
MANFLYPWARNAFLTGHAGWTPNWGSDTVNVMFINGGVGTNYTFSGTGVTGYAWQPSLSETNAQAGYAITYVSQVPIGHRTMAAGTIGANFGGGAVTHNLLSKVTLGNGVADASDVVVYEVPSGSAVSAFVIYRYVAAGSTPASDAASHLIAFFDSAQGMPVLGNGGDITVVWSSGDTRIFKL